MGSLKPRVRLLLPGLCIVASLLATLLAVADDSPNKATSKAGKSKAKQEVVAQKYVRAVDPTLYVGTETCKTCHEDMPSKDFYKNYENSPHFVTTMDTKRGPEWHGCEACHGPGKAHVEGGGDKTKIFSFKAASAADASARCLDCHQLGQEHSNFARSAHLQNNVGCADCHSPHHAKEGQFLMKDKQPQLCYTCHLDKKQQFTRTF